MGRTAKIFTSLLAALCVIPVSGAYAEGYGQGRETDAQNRPCGAVRFQEQFGELGVYALSPEENRIILTFDQGYENGYTAQILDTLREKHATAIFFLTGDYAKKEHALVRRMIDEGHMLGNHGMTHAALPKLSESEIEEEVMSLHRYILGEYGYEMQYFRPPCGEYDAVSLAKLQAMGYHTIFWSAAHVDWIADQQPDPAESLQKLSGMAHSGCIYLLHSVSSTNTQILGGLIDTLRAQGYTV